MGSLSLGSLTDSLSSGEGTGDGSSTTSITDQIAKTIGGLVETALKSVLGNLS